jgi:hypothetical protein
VIFSAYAARIDRIRTQSPQLPFVSFAVGNGLAVRKAERLDALKISQMEAVERYAFNPPHPILEACVLKAPALIEQGLPRFAISGVALPADYPRHAKLELELDISATLKAIRDFNKRGEDQILRVGILPEGLSLDKIAPAEVFEALERVYRGLPRG